MASSEIDEKRIQGVPTVADLQDSSSNGDKTTNGHDIGADMFNEVQHYTSEELESERARVRKKIDRILMPIICITYILQFLDKLSLNYASAYTLIPDLGLTGQKFSTVASASNYGAIAWSIPTNFLLQRLPVGKYTGAMITIWGILLLCMAAVKGFGGIFAMRFLLGMAEANIAPANMMICSMFYTRKEQPFRMCIFLSMNGGATAVGSLIGFGLGHVNSTAIASWQLIFLVIGAANFIWSFVFLYMVPDSPMTARWLTHEERIVAVGRVSENMIGIKDPEFKWYQVREAFLDAKVWIMILIASASGILNGGLGNFGSALIKGYGFSGLNATLLQLPTGILELVCLPIAGYFATRYKDLRCYMFFLFTIPALGGFLGIRFTPISHKWSLVGSTWLLYIVGAQAILSYNLLVTNFAGHTKRATTNSIWFVIYSAGSVAGTNVFFAREKPRYFSAITALLICTFATLLFIIMLRLVMWWDNKKRDREFGVRDVTHGEADDEAIRLGFLDKTDFENKHFRYGL